MTEVETLKGSRIDFVFDVVISNVGTIRISYSGGDAIRQDR